MQSGNKMLESLGYKINDRSFSSVAEFLSPFPEYARLEFMLEPDSVLYTGAEHKEKILTKKLPNLTHLPNIAVKGGMIVMGCTMGHHQDMPGFSTEPEPQEIYEFHGYGAMVIDHDDKTGIDMVIAHPGEKVVVPNRCHMTLYNLDNMPLDTSDFADPNENSKQFNAANKKMQKGKGPVMCVYKQDGVHFLFNPEYSYVDGVVSVDAEPGLELCEAIVKMSDKFVRRGVTVKRADPDLELRGERVVGSLIDIIMTTNVIQRYFRAYY